MSDTIGRPAGGKVVTDKGDDKKGGERNAQEQLR
jgi:hypothetical protein